MRSLDKNINGFLQACIACGGLPLKARTAPLCGFCEKFFLKNAALISRQHEGWSVHSLWPWQDDASVVGEVVRQLKGGGPEDIYDYFAQLFLQQWFIGRGRIEKGAIVIPAPGREGSAAQDHAFCFARSLAKIIGGELKTPLLRPHLREQKLQNKMERHQQQFVTREIFQEGQRQVIFVDDVIVTGGTIEAAYRALNAPENFMAWCLADRVKLC